VSFADNAEGDVSADGGEWIDPAELEALGGLLGDSEPDASAPQADSGADAPAAPVEDPLAPPLP
jgi:hypothetical protein